MTWKEHAVVFLQEINSQSAVKKSDKVNGKPGFTVTNLLPYPCSGKNLISNLVTDYIQKRSGEPGLFSFEYNLLPKFHIKENMSQLNSNLASHQITTFIWLGLNFFLQKACNRAIKVQNQGETFYDFISQCAGFHFVYNVGDRQNESP